MTEIDCIANSEVLYRRARSGTLVERGGRLVCSIHAFTDRQSQPSVDRAELTGFNPEHTRLEDGDGVLELHAGDVREIRIVKNDRKGRVVGEFAIDVIADPEENNLAHAIIAGEPQLTSGPFRRLREELADRASIILAPTVNG